MEISLLTGVNIVLTIFDKDEGKVIQYLSDSMDKFTAISHIKKLECRKREHPGAKPKDHKEGAEPLYV